MQTIGERLEEARKKKGISIREAAEATKIRGDYLSKFESNQFDIGLTELYVRGFLRTYAQFLRVPADRIVNDYASLGRGEKKPRQPSREIYGRMDVSISSADTPGEVASTGGGEPSHASPPAHRAPHTPRRNSSADTPSVDPALVFKILKIAGAVLVVALLVWGGITLFRGSSPNRGAHATNPPTQAANPAPTTATPNNAATPLDQTITLIASDTVRVKVVSVTDGRVLLPDTTLNAGQTQVVSKPGPIYITYSAGKNLQVEVGGKRYPMPTEGWDRAQIK